MNIKINDTTVSFVCERCGLHNDIKVETPFRNMERSLECSRCGLKVNDGDPYDMTLKLHRFYLSLLKNDKMVEGLTQNGISNEDDFIRWSFQHGYKPWRVFSGFGKGWTANVKGNTIGVLESTSDNGEEDMKEVYRTLDIAVKSLKDTLDNMSGTVHKVRETINDKHSRDVCFRHKMLTIDKLIDRANYEISCLSDEINTT